MKKVLAIFAVAAIFAACNNNGSNTEAKADSAVNTASAAADSAAKAVTSTVDSAAAKVDSTVKAATDTTKKK